MNKETDSIVRYCKPTHIDDGKILAAAFLLRKKDMQLNRPNDEKELSVDHYEFFLENNYHQIINALERRGIKPKANGYLVKIKYANIFKDIQENLFLNIDIETSSTSHCLIHNLYQNDEDASFFFLKNITDKVKIDTIT
jgi:hypothetical protein